MINISFFLTGLFLILAWWGYMVSAPKATPGRQVTSSAESSTAPAEPQMPTQSETDSLRSQQ